MRQLYKNICQTFLIIILLAGGLYFFPGCSSFEDGTIGSFPFMEINQRDTSVSNTTHEIVIPVNTNREWTVNVNYENYDDSQETGWISAVPSNDYKTLTLNIQKNTQESPRAAYLTITTTNETSSVTFKIEQDASSDRTFEGMLVLPDQEAIDNNQYTKVTGIVVIGNLLNFEYNRVKSAGRMVQIQIGDSLYTVETSNISDLSALSKIKEIKSKTLFILNNEINNIPASVINNLNISRLHLNWNNMTELDSIKELRSVKDLSIAHNQIEDISALSQLNNIQKLNIAGNQIRDISALSSMPQITNLILGEGSEETNRIMNLSVLNQLPALDYVSLSGLPVDKEQIDKLNLPPNCKVEAEELKESGLPIVTTYEPIGTTEELKLQGSVKIKDETVTIESYGFYYGTTNNPDQMTWLEGQRQDTSFNATVTALESKRYYIYAAVKTSEGTVFGDQRTFGENYHTGDIIIKNSSDIADFKDNGYSSIEGSIIIGNASESDPGNSIAVNINGKTYYFTKNQAINEISYLTGLSRVSGGIYIINTEVSSLTPLTQVGETPVIYAKANKLTEVPDLTMIEGLKELNLSGNEITDIKNLSALTGLTTLSLGDKAQPAQESNEIRDVTPLHNLSNLTNLDISGLPLSNQAIEALIAALPNCTIEAEGMKTPASPVVTTNAVTEITSNGARLNGTLNSQGDAEVNEYGFYWGQDQNNMEKVTVGYSLNPGYAFDSYLNNLTMGNSYYVRAYCTNEYGEGLGEIVEFVAGATFEGNLFLRTQAEVNNFPSRGYNKINGNLIIGTAADSQFDGYKSAYQFNNTTYYFGDTDITSLDSLVKLSEVSNGVYILCNQQLSDIKPLSNLKNTTYINLESNHISDITPLSEISGLQNLNLSNNPISDWQPINQISQLRHLYVGNCDISDLSVFQNLSSLNSLSCYSNQITDLSPLAQLTELNSLQINNNQIQDITILSGLNKLTNLNISNNQIKNLNALSNLQSLRYLYCYNNQINDLSPLENLNLNNLDCERNQISDISVLKNHTNLTSLYLGTGINETNTIHDVEALKNLSNLKYLYLHGLPLTQTQVDELRTNLSGCEIYADNLRDYAPVFGTVSVSVSSNTEADLNAEITSEGVSSITERGFYYGMGSTIDSMTKVVVSGKTIGKYAYKLSGLQESTTYYVKAFASNASTTAYSDAVIFRTYGQPVVQTLQMQSGTSAVEGKITFTGGEITAYGAVWSLSGEPNINSYTGIQRIQGTVNANEVWQAELTSLQPGYTYNVRCFAENNYGTAYGDIIQYTVPGELPKNNYILNATIPNFQTESGAVNSPINMIYAYYYKAGLSGQGKAVGPTASSDNQYTYSLPATEQQLIFCNLNTNGDNYQIENLISDDQLLRIHQTKGTNGIGSDIVTATKEVNLTGEVTESVNMTREVARLNFAVQAKDANGATISNISELLSSVTINVNNFYSDIEILSDQSSLRKGNITNVVSCNVTSSDSKQTVAENIYTFPTIAGKKNTTTLEVDFKDGRTIQLSSQLPQTIEANKVYSVTLTISENKSNHSFTIDKIEVVEETIEF